MGRVIEIPSQPSISSEQFRLRLEQERDQLHQAIAGAEDQLKQLGHTEIDKPPEFGSTSYVEDLLERSSHQRERLRIVLQGLRRVHQGTYGVCLRCEREIGAKRLEAIPSAQYCFACQEQIEQEQM